MDKGYREVLHDEAMGLKEDVERKVRDEGAPLDAAIREVMRLRSSDLIASWPTDTIVAAIDNYRNARVPEYDERPERDDEVWPVIERDQVLDRVREFTQNGPNVAHSAVLAVAETIILHDLEEKLRDLVTRPDDDVDRVRTHYSFAHRLKEADLAWFDSGVAYVAQFRSGVEPRYEVSIKVFEWDGAEWKMVRGYGREKSGTRSHLTSAPSSHKPYTDWVRERWSC